MAKSLSENSAAESTTEASAVPASTRDQQAMALVTSYVPWSVGAGILHLPLPLPGVDMLALTAVHLRMLSKLSEMYGVPFMENGAKSIIATLLGTVISTNLGASLASALRMVPWVGPVVGIAAMPSLYSAATYAVGRVFVAHFESGGTFLNFDPQKMRAHFASEFETAAARPGTQK